MVPMQNALAGKKHDFKKEHDFKKARSSSVINRNTNDLSATLSSSNTAANTNNINNTNTQNQSQGQNACIAVLECTAASSETEGTTPPPCNPSTVGGQTAIRTDDTCTATIFFSAGKLALAIFGDECQRIPGSTLHSNDEISITCTFPSTPPT